MLRFREMIPEANVTPYDPRTADPTAWAARIAALAKLHEGRWREARATSPRPRRKRRAESYARLWKPVIARHKVTGETRKFGSAAECAAAIGASKEQVYRAAGRRGATSAKGWILIYEQAAQCTIR